MRTGSLVGNRPFRALWAYNSCTAMASLLFSLILMVHIYDTTGSVIGASMVLVCTSFSSFISSLLGTFYINKISPRAILRIVAFSGVSITLLICAILRFNFDYNLYIVLFLVSVRSFVNAWHGPARFGILAHSVSKDQYIKASGVLTITSHTINTGGWALGGLLAAVAPFWLMSIIIACLYLTSGIVTNRLCIPDSLPGPRQSNGQYAKRNWTILIFNPVVRSITIMELFEYIANSVWTSPLMLPFATVVLKAGNEGWGLLNAAYFIGAIIGSYFVIKKSNVLTSKLGSIMALSCVAMGLETFALVILKNTVCAIIIVVIMGPLYEARSTCQSRVLRDELLPKDRMGVSATRNILLTPWNTLSIVAMSYLAQRFGIEFVFYVAACLYLLTAVIAISMPELRKHGFGHTNLEA